MLALMKDWKGTVEINGTTYETMEDAFKGSNLKDGEQFQIKLLPKTKRAKQSTNINESDEKQEYRITVKKYMTEKSVPGFDFMAKWNNDEPMPLRMMTGYIDKETKGMVHMVLHGDMYAAQMCTCMKCGKRLTNKVSQYFGIGPECGGHNYTHPFETEEELDKAVEQYKAKLQAITWTGWVVRSAITEQEEV